LQASTAQDIRTYKPEGDGSFAVRRIVGRALTLRLIREGISVAQTVLPASFDDGELRLDLPDTSVQGYLESGESHLDIRLLSVSTPGLRAWTQTLAGGGFQVPFLPPGAYILEIQGQPASTFTVAAGDSQDLGAVTPPAGTP
jgi:hypothetical protein